MKPAKSRAVFLLMKKLWAVLFLLLMIPACRAFDEHTVAKELEFAKTKRTYLLHVPPNVSKPAPLVIVLHGGGGKGSQMEEMSGFTALSDKAGFIAAYPDGIGRNWYDGREGDFSEAHKEKRDDSGFIGAMIDEIAKHHEIDEKRIYATGISNGGFMSNYLAVKLNAKLAAVAPVIGGIGDPFHKEFKLETPVSALIIQGTDDPLVPYNGGEVAKGRGKLISTEQALRLWVTATGCKKEPATDALDDRDPKDSCRVTRMRYTGGKAEVEFLKVVGGGHTWPGGPQYLPKMIVGTVCRDFDCAYIWEFFKAHPKQDR